MQRPDPVTDRPQVRTALLLAAGLGCRLAPLTEALPKCLVSVSGVPILERLVRALDGHGFERLVIVTGYQAETIRDYLGERFGGITVEYIVSPLFATTNNIYSLWLARQLIDEPFLLVESDVVFDESLLAPLLQPGPDRRLPAAAVDERHHGHARRGTATSAPSTRRRRASTVSTAPTPGHFMAVNICSLARDTWGEVCERLDQHVAAGQTGFFYESVFEEMTADGSMALAAVIFPAERWYEIDTPADLAAAELVFPRHPHAAGGSKRRGHERPRGRGEPGRLAAGVRSRAHALLRPRPAQPLLAGRAARRAARALLRDPRRLPGGDDRPALGRRLRLERRPHRAPHEGPHGRATGVRGAARFPDRRGQLQRRPRVSCSSASGTSALGSSPAPS